MIDFERARATMVRSQLRTDKVTDRRILSAFAALPRERFVPEAKRELAYSDASLEVWPSIDGAPARFLLPPVVLGRLIQLAAVEAERCGARCRLRHRLFDRRACAPRPYR